MGKLCNVTLTKGDMAISLMGHDKNRYYIVIAELSDDFVLVADGIRRSVDDPKLKRRKHLKFVCKTDATCDDISIRKIILLEEQNAKRR